MFKIPSLSISKSILLFIPSLSISPTHPLTGTLSETTVEHSKIIPRVDNNLEL